MTGVYFLFKGKTLLYIGATKKWPNRLLQHKEIDFDSAKIIECHQNCLFSYEKRLIQILKPEINIQHAQSPRRKPVFDWVAKNQEVVKTSFENGLECDLVKIVQKELGYSLKTSYSDISFVILKNYQRVTGEEFNRKKKKFKKQLV